MNASSRSDAMAKAAGRVRYAQDIYPERMLHGVILRSPYARALIRSVDVAPALAVPGVVVALGPSDVPRQLFGDVVPDEPLLARDETRYLGQPVALVAAETRAAASAAALAIEVHYQQQQPVLTLSEAVGGDVAVVPGEPNLLRPSRVSRGDVGAAFSQADVVVIETEVVTQRVHQGYIELRSALAEIDEHGRLVVTMTSQCPFQVRSTLAQLFGLRLTDVIVKVPALGGGFGGKLHAGMAPYAAALALAAGQPVQVVCQRDEDLQAANPRESSRVTVRSAVAPDGRIVGRIVSGYFDSGAFTIDTPYITSMAAMQACGPYDVDAVECAIYPVRTNLQPTGSFRSPSGPQMAFAIERHMDDIAARLELSPLEFRRSAAMRDGSIGPSGQRLVNPPIRECLDAVDSQIRAWRAQARRMTPPPGRVYGFGQAACWWFTAPGASAVTIRLEEDGSVGVFTGATEIGTGAVVSGVRALVAGALHLDPGKVQVITGSTELPADFGSEGSRTLYGCGNAALGAVDEIKRILGDHLRVGPENLELHDGMVSVRDLPGSCRPLGALVGEITAAAGPVLGNGRFQAASVAYDPALVDEMLIPAFHEPTFHSQGAWVEVDPELGRVAVKKYVAAHDVGHVIDWAGVKGQIEGGVVQGLGYALLEEIQTDPLGRTRNPNLADYRMPTIGDVPEEIVICPIVSSPSSEGPAGAKGIGEAPVILPAAVIAAAIQDATGLRLTTLPMGPAQVALRQQAVPAGTRPA